MENCHIGTGPECSVRLRETVFESWVSEDGLRYTKSTETVKCVPHPRPFLLFPLLLSPLFRPLYPSFSSVTYTYGRKEVRSPIPVWFWDWLDDKVFSQHSRWERGMVPQSFRFKEISEVATPGNCTVMCNTTFQKQPFLPSRFLQRTHPREHTTLLSDTSPHLRK